MCVAKTGSESNDIEIVNMASVIIPPKSRLFIRYNGTVVLFKEKRHFPCMFPKPKNKTQLLAGIRINPNKSVEFFIDFDFTVSTYSFYHGNIGNS